MQIFLSHNKDDVGDARLLAVALVGLGAGVWFDEWEIRPGSSITGGIEAGLREADVFVLLWSQSAAKSGWVGAELSAYLHKRLANESLRIVPILVDKQALPPLIADYRGFKVGPASDLAAIAAALVGGKPAELEHARILQERLLELMNGRALTGDPLPYLVCPTCASTRLKRATETDYRRDDTYLVITCEDCGWADFTEL